MNRGTRRLLAAALVVLLGLAGCSAHRSPAPSGSAQEPSAWDGLVQRTGADGTVDLPTALSAFALAIGPVPGGAPPAGRKAPIPSGTIAVSWVLSHWAELGADQRRAVMADLDVPTSAASPAGYVPRAPRAPAPVNANLPCLTADSAGAERYRAQLSGIEEDFRTHLGRPFAFPKTVFISVNTKNLEGSMLYTWDCVGTAKAGRDLGDQVTGCTIHVNPKVDQGGYTDAELHSFLIHEMAHCYLYGLFGAAYDRMPGWYLEGVPSYLMDRLGGSSVRLTGIWRDYLTTSFWPLYQRTYSGLGFFVHLAETGTDPFGVIVPIGTAMAPLAANGPIAETRAGWAAAQVTPAFLDSWGSGFVQHRYPGAAWTSGDPNLPTIAVPFSGTLGSKNHPTTKPAAAPLGNGGTETFTASEYAADVEEIHVDAEVVTVTAASGTSGRVSLGGGRDATFGGGPYCTLSGCTCPAGSPGEGTHLDPMSSGQQYLGLSGGDRAGSVTLVGQSLKDFCSKPQRSCLVGQWTSTGFAAQGPITESGGAGVRLHIDPQGRLTTLFDGMAPIAFTATFGSAPPVAGQFVFHGSDSADLTLPPASATSGDHIVLRNGDVSKLSVTAQITSPIRYTLGPLGLGQLAGAGGASGALNAAPIGANAWDCSGTTMHNFVSIPVSGNGPVTGTWTFSRTGPG